VATPFASSGGASRAASNTGRLPTAGTRTGERRATSASARAPTSAASRTRWSRARRARRGSALASLHARRLVRPRPAIARSKTLRPSASRRRKAERRASGACSKGSALASARTPTRAAKKTHSLVGRTRRCYPLSDERPVPEVVEPDVSVARDAIADWGSQAPGRWRWPRGPAGQSGTISSLRARRGSGVVGSAKRKPSVVSPHRANVITTVRMRCGWALCVVVP